MAIHTNPANLIVESLSSPQQTVQTKRLHVPGRTQRAAPDSPSTRRFRRRFLWETRQYHPFGRRGTSSTKFDWSAFPFSDLRPAPDAI
jgi:hypothetical protein